KFVIARRAAEGYLVQAVDKRSVISEITGAKNLQRNIRPVARISWFALLDLIEARLQLFGRRLTSSEIAILLANEEHRIVERPRRVNVKRFHLRPHFQPASLS